MIDIDYATINIEDIEISDRARKEYGDIKELANSIKESGLINPLAVQKVNEGEKPFKLLAGERRLMAKKLNGDTTTPVRIYPSTITRLEAKSVELAENFYRKDFTWLELIKNQKEIHDLMQELHGKKISTLPDSTGWSMADTADLVGRSKQSVSKDLRVANAVELMPELFAGCKNKLEAEKILNKMEESVIRTELAKRVETGKGSDLMRRLTNSYIIGDFFEKAKSIQDGLFNLIEIDPPYAIDLCNIKKGDNVNFDKTDYNEIDPDGYKAFMTNIFKECYRLAAEHSWLLCWFAPDPWFQNINTWIRDAGFETTAMPCVWIKTHGQSLNPNTRLANSYEMFFYAWKGSPALARPGASNTFIFPADAPQKKIHPTQRPINLMAEIYSTFSFEGSRVLIPCGGSGSGIIAANECRMNAVATEINPSYRDGYLLMLNDYLNGN